MSIFITSKEVQSAMEHSIPIGNGSRALDLIGNFFCHTFGMEDHESRFTSALINNDHEDMITIIKSGFSVKEDYTFGKGVAELLVKVADEVGVSILLKQGLREQDRELLRGEALKILDGNDDTHKQAASEVLSRLNKYPIEASANKKQQMLVVAGKVALVITVMALLVGASVTSFGAAGALMASGVAIAGQVGALYGLSGGLLFATGAAVPIAISNNMHKFTQHNLKDVGSFIVVQAITTIFSAAVGVIIGAYNSVAITKFFHPNASFIRAGDFVHVIEGRSSWNFTAPIDIAFNAPSHGTVIQAPGESLFYQTGLSNLLKSLLS